jgi:hypothetical protein
MTRLLLWAGRLCGLLGLALLLLAIGFRASGRFHVGDLAVGTVLQGAVALMVVGCLAYVAALAERRP